MMGKHKIEQKLQNRNKKLRIAVMVNFKVSYGGGERILNMIIDQLRRTGHEVYVYAYAEEWLAEASRFDKLRILKEVPVWKRKIASFLELRRVLKEDRPDAMLCFSLVFGETAVWACKSAGVAYITSERCDPRIVPVPGKEWVRRVLRPITFANSSAVVFQTGRVRDYFSKRIRRRGYVIPNPVIDDELPQPNPNPSKVIVAAGRLDVQKRFDVLIDAFAKLAPGHGYVLKIYGQGPLRDELQNSIDRLGLKQSVLLMGQAKKMVDVLQEADIFVLSSDHEGFPNALIEGMAMGLACVSTDFYTGAAAELIRDGENGFLVPTGDSDAMAKAIQCLVSDPGLRAKFRSEASKVRIRLSKEKIIPQWIDIIARKAAR